MCGFVACGQQRAALQAVCLLQAWLVGAPVQLMHVLASCPNPRALLNPQHQQSRWCTQGWAVYLVGAGCPSICFGTCSRHALPASLPFGARPGSFANCLGMVHCCAAGTLAFVGMAQGASGQGCPSLLVLHALPSPTRPQPPSICRALAACCGDGSAAQGVAGAPGSTVGNMGAPWAIGACPCSHAPSQHCSCVRIVLRCRAPRAGGTHQHQGGPHVGPCVACRQLDKRLPGSLAGQGVLLEGMQVQGRGVCAATRQHSTGFSTCFAGGMLPTMSLRRAKCKHSRLCLGMPLAALGSLCTARWCSFARARLHPRLCSLSMQLSGDGDCMPEQQVQAHGLLVVNRGCQLLAATSPDQQCPSRDACSGCVAWLPVPARSGCQWNAVGGRWW